MDTRMSMTYEELKQMLEEDGLIIRTKDPTVNGTVYFKEAIDYGRALAKKTGHNGNWENIWDKVRRLVCYHYGKTMVVQLSLEYQYEANNIAKKIIDLIITY